ncbi:MAG: DoxX family protein [Patescibacteria group bacterium]
MLNPFPELLAFSLLGPFILRLVAGIVFVNLGRLSLKEESGRWLISLTALKIPRPDIATKILSILEIVGGLMLIVGLYTQISALVLSILVFAEAYIEYRDPALLKRSLVFYLLLLSINLSLLLSGAGAFAIDLPL